MPVTRTLPISCLLPAAIVIAATAASAQTGAVPPEAQGAGGNVTRPGTRNTLHVSALLAEAYDDDAPAELAPTIDPTGLNLGGYSTMLIASADYSWISPAFQFAAGGGSAVRYLADRNEIRTISHNAAVGMSVRLPKRTTWVMNQTAAYSPSYLYGLFPRAETIEPGVSTPTAPDYAITDVESYLYGTATTLTHGLTRRNNVSLSAEYQRTDFTREVAGRRDLTSYRIQSRFARNLARNVSVSVGYRFRAGDFGYVPSSGGTINLLESQTSTEHGLEMAWNYSRLLSRTRRATVGFSISPSMAQLPQLVDAIGPQNFRQLGGQVMADYQFRPGWQATGTYRRGFEYIAELGEPVFTGGFSAGVTGLLTRKTDLSVSAGYSSGESVLQRTNMFFDTYTGEARVRYALTPSVAAYAQYVYYFYDFGGNSQLAPAVPRRFERNGVRVGLTMRVAALGR